MITEHDFTCAQNGSPEFFPITALTFTCEQSLGIGTARLSGAC